MQLVSASAAEQRPHEVHSGSMGTGASILTKKLLVVSWDCGATDMEAAIASLIEAIPEGMQKGAPPLIAVAAVGNCETVRWLLGSGLGLNASNSVGMTPVHWAVAVDSEPVIRSLLTLGEHGATRLHLDAKDANGFTPLHYAAVTCKSLAAHLLLAAGASVDCRDVGGQTPLMKAAKRNDVAMCGALLDAGADPAAADAFGQTALHEAAIAGGLATRLLMERGARHVAAAADVLGRTPLNYALRYSQLDAARALLPAAHFTPCTDEMGRTELHWAAANGTADIVERLLSCGPQRWPCDDACMTPLMLALEARNEKTVEVLLEAAGRSDGVSNKLGMTALHLATRAGLAGAVGRLLQRGGDAWRPDQDGRDALIWAVYGGDEEALAAVLRHAGFRQFRDRFGRTALHVAAVRGNAAVALKLLQSGADPNTVDLRGWTPLTSAICHESYAVVEVLQCWADHSAPPLKAWCPQDDAGRKDPNSLDLQGWTPLDLALFRQSYDVIEILQ